MHYARLSLIFLFWTLEPLLGQGAWPGAATVAEVMHRANGYWISNSSLGNAGWARSAYYTGNQRAFRVLGQESYWQRALAWGAANGWKIGPEGFNSADAYCCGQTYIDLYRLDQKPVYVENLRQNVDALVASSRIDYWSWIDAFYMAAPVLARFYALDANTNSSRKLWLMYDDMRTRRGLFDAEAGLWFRDGNWIYPRQVTSNSNKVFWGRGNGWVIAGLARVLEQVGTNDAHRADYASMLQTMAAALVPLQQPDGMWRSSLLEPTQYPNPETSGTAFFTYAIAWGMRHGYLAPETYSNVVLRAWQGMTNLALHPNGQLGYIQAPGASPAAANYNSTYDYGVGAFLLAGSEIYLLAQDATPIRPWAGADQDVPDTDGNGTATVELDASETEIYRGFAVSYYWWRTNTVLASGKKTQVTLPQGKHLLTLKVLGSDGVQYTDDVLKTVYLAPPIVPNAGADELVRTPNLERAVELNGTGTIINRGSATKWTWWIGNLLLASGPVAEATLPLGRHVIALQVQSDAGLSYTDQVVKVVAPLPVSTTASTYQSPNFPSNTIDGSLDTRWSALGAGQWILYDLGRTLQVSGVHVATYQGNQRRAHFAIEASETTNRWALVCTNSSSGTTLALERFPFSPVSARYVRLTGYGSTVTDWNSYTEIAIEAQATDTDADLDGLPDTWEEVRLGSTAAMPLQDTDGDGLSNLQEYLAGTDPEDAASCLRLIVLSARTNRTLQVGFQSQPAFGCGYAGLSRYYVLESCPGFGTTPTGWTPVPGFHSIFGDGLFKTCSVPLTNTTRFLRLRGELK